MIFHRYRFVLLINIFLIASRGLISAQDTSRDEMLPGLRERAVIMDISARIVEQNQHVVWISEESRVTIPGRPVGIKLVGANIVVAVQFTPYFRSRGRGGSFLVAQGQVWIHDPNRGMSYHTSIQTIPMEFGELIYFFPLGSSHSNEARIEIQLRLRPYSSGVSEAWQGNLNSP